MIVGRVLVAWSIYILNYIIDGLYISLFMFDRWMMINS